MAMTHKILLIALMSGAALDVGIAQEPAASEAVFYEFLHALGEPALIGANADHEMAKTAFRPIPAMRTDALDPDKMRLGFDLFHENRFAIDQSVGCNNCHSGMFGGTDGRTVSTGARGQPGKLNSPTTFNAAFNFRQFWDGRAVTLADQALGPIENELEMANELSAVLDMLRADANYPAEFAAVYPDGITVNNMADAIAYFQRVNFTRPTTPFVRHLAGEEGQMSEQALQGWQRFNEIGCVSCHNGINLGGNSYQQLGSAMDYFVEHRVAGQNDDGIFGRSGRSNDKHVFKVPTLHGIAETAPYFHDGSVETLESAIAEMGEHQLGMMLSDKDIQDIAAFLNSLGGRPMGMAMGNMGMGRGMGMRGGMSGGMGGGMSGGMGMGMGRGMSPPNTTADSAQTTAKALPDPATHDVMYAATVAAVTQANNKIVSEMQRIQNADVAHFDFLQFEHLELIRHARALAFPPADMSAQSRQTLQEHAERLLAASHELEWIIADFLRAYAMSDVTDRQINPPEAVEFVDDLPDPVQQRSRLQAQLSAMLDAMRNSGVNEAALALNTAYAAVK